MTKRKNIPARYFGGIGSGRHGVLFFRFMSTIALRSLLTKISFWIDDQENLGHDMYP